jgi:hypothetical protein
MFSSINKLDFLIICLLFVFILDVLAILTLEDVGIFVTAVGGTVTIVGYAFIRPQFVEACELNGGK